MYKTLSLVFKQAKTKKGATFITNLNIMSNNSKLLMRYKPKMINNFSQKFFSAEEEPKFEQIPRPVGSYQHGNLNLKSTYHSESLGNLLNYISNKSTQMNNTDYNEVINLFGNKLENDYNNRIRIENIDKLQGAQLVKSYILVNFDILLKDKFCASSLLLLTYQITSKTKKNSFFTREQEMKIVDANLEILNQSFQNMTLVTILNYLSLLAQYKFINPVQFIKQREEDLSNMNFLSMSRILRRLADPRINQNMADILYRFISKEFLNVTLKEKFNNKTKAFLIMSQLDHQLPFVLNSRRIFLLLKDIRAQAENHDPNSMLNVLEGLTYMTDPVKYDVQKELYEIVITTIQQQPDFVKLDFMLKLFDILSKSYSNDVLSHDQLKIMFEHVIYNVSNLGEDRKIMNLKSLSSPFTIMRKSKFYDSDITTKLISFMAPKLHIMSVDEDLFNVKLIVSKVLGEQYFSNLSHNVLSELQQTMIREKLNFRLFSNLAKASFWDPKSTLSVELSDLIIKDILLMIDNASKPFSLIFQFEQYVKYQNFIQLQYKTQILEKMLQRFEVNDYGMVSNTRNAILLIEIKIPKERNDLKEKITDILKIITTNSQFKKQLIRNYQHLSRNGDYISNATIYKFNNIIRDLCTAEEFISHNPRILEILNSIAFNFAYKFDNNGDISLEAINSILHLIDFLKQKNPQLEIEVPFHKILVFLKHFMKRNLSAKYFNYLYVIYLKKFNLKESLNRDEVMIIERVLKSQLPTNEKKELLERVFPDTSKIESLFNNENLKGQIFKLYCNINWNHKNIISDENIKNCKRLIIENINSPNISNNLKLNYILSLHSLKENFLKEEEIKELGAVIKSVFSQVSIRQALKTLENFTNYNRSSSNRFLNKIMFEIANCYEKTDKVEKFNFKKILEIYTMKNWKNANFYNKIIRDYEVLYNSFDSEDNCHFVNCFSRVGLNKEDVVRAACKNLTIKHLNENQKLALFNSLINLNFYTQEWKELILESLLQNIDFRSSRIEYKEKIITLLNLWKLTDFPQNKNEIVDFYADQLNKFFATIKTPLKYANTNIDDIFLLKRSPYYAMFNEEAKASIDELFKIVKQKYSKNNSIMTLVEYLKSMGHENISFLPENSLCHILLPDSKIAILWVDSNQRNVIENKNIPEVDFMISQLEQQGYLPTIIQKFKLNDVLKGSKSEVVSYLESIKIPKLKTGELDFTNVDNAKNRSNKKIVTNQVESSSDEE